MKKSKPFGSAKPSAEVGVREKKKPSSPSRRNGEIISMSQKFQFANRQRENHWRGGKKTFNGKKKVQATSKQMKAANGRG